MTTKETPTMYANWQETVKFGEKGPSPTVLIETPRLKAVLGGLRAEQSIPMHPSPEAIYHFLKGTGTMTVDDEKYTVGPGITVTVPDGSQRGITAETDVVFIGTTVPG